MDSFINFYNNLSSTGIFFFLVAILLFIFLIILTVVLIIKNKKLANALDNTIEIKEELPIKENNEKKIILEEEKELVTSKENKLEDQELISSPVVDKIEVNIKSEAKEKVADEPVKEVVEEKIKINLEKPRDEIKKVDSSEVNNGLYQRNVLRQMNMRMQTSPININKNIETKDYDEYVSNIREESMVSPLEEMEDAYNANDNMKDIIKKMEEEQKPDNIELTDYEKKQEEEAIISYDELQKVKDKIYNITDDEETDEFIDELKNFRLDLE